MTAQWIPKDPAKGPDLYELLVMARHAAVAQAVETETCFDCGGPLTDKRHEAFEGGWHCDRCDVRYLEATE